MELSARKIRTGVYHADVAPEAKSAMHEQWRSGRVHVVCATIAFGLGIDKGDVRFVIHHTVRRKHPYPSTALTCLHRSRFVPFPWTHCSSD